LGVAGVDLRSYRTLRLIHTGAAPAAEQTLRRAREIFGCAVIHAYGLTEATAAVAAMNPSDYAAASAERTDRLLSVGRPLVGTEVRILGPDDQPVPAGTVGEIAVRGPQVMRGYWNQPAATAEALRDGWLHTGDAGLLDAEGYLYIRDRLKDVIITGGVNVYPRMVEQVLLEPPGVSEVGVIGVPDPHWGERVHAVVVRPPGI